MHVLTSAPLRRIAAIALLLVGFWTPSVASADTVTFKAGSYVIDMGRPTQTNGNALKPYGLIYDLVTNYHVPVNWAINPAKTTFRLDAGDPIPVDFTATTTAGVKSYGGGSFIVDVGFLTPSVITAVNTWTGQGVVVDTLAAALTTEIYGRVTSFPRTVLATDGALVTPYYTNAGVPAAAYRIGVPTDLSPCDDVFILTNNDLSTWSVAYHQALLDFVANGGGLFAGGQSVSQIENTLVGTTQLSFLSNGLNPFYSHDDGTPPYSYNPAAANDPIMQIMNRLDAATANGSEQIYVPNSLQWRAATTVAVYDPDHPNNPAGGTSPFNRAAALAYGFAYGNPTKGLVVYEGGDSLAGNDAANIAAQRAFFNFILTQGILKSPWPAVTMPAIVQGTPATLLATISGGSGSYGYQWVSTDGGDFSAPSGTWNVGDPPLTTQYTMIAARDTIRLLVTDTCGRHGFFATNLGNTEIVSIAKVNDAAEPATDGKFRLTVSGGPSLTNTNISYSVAGTATSGSDYAALTGTVLIPAGAAAADIDIDVVDDVIVEATETVVIELGSSDNADISIDSLHDTASLNITDNDTAVYTINDVSANESAGTLTFTISVSNAVDIPVTVDVTYTDQSATGASGGVGADYDNDADQVTFTAQDTSDKTVTVAITNDAISETDETFRASLSTATALGGRSVTTSDQGTGTIRDNGVAAIDVRPGNSSNSINLNENGLIPIALFGTASFDVTQVSLNTLRFAGASVFKSARQDVNGDGRLDLLLQFRIQDTNLRNSYKELLAAADTTINGILDAGVSTHQQFGAALTGHMLSGGSFAGSDTVDLFMAGRELRRLVQELVADGVI
jgi:hypothetical protein